MLLDDVADVLSSGGMGTVGSTADWGIYKGVMPDAPAKAVAVYETGGPPAIHAMRSCSGAAVATRPTVQLIVRSPSYSTGRQKAQDAFRLLDGMRERQINGVRYMGGFALQSEPFSLGRDENDRILVACNFSFVKAMSSA